MDYLTAFGRLFVCLLAIGLSFRLFDYLPKALWLYFGYLTVFSAIWLSFRYFTVFWLFNCLSAFWQSVRFLTVFWLFDFLFSYLTICLLFKAIWMFSGYLAVFRLFWLSFRLSDTLLLAIWVSFGLFDCLFCNLIVFWLFDCLLAIWQALESQ